MLCIAHLFTVTQAPVIRTNPNKTHSLVVTFYGQFWIKFWVLFDLCWGAWIEKASSLYISTNINNFYVLFPFRLFSHNFGPFFGLHCKTQALKIFLVQMLVKQHVSHFFNSIYMLLRLTFWSKFGVVFGLNWRALLQVLSDSLVQIPTKEKHFYTFHSKFFGVHIYGTESL